MNIVQVILTPILLAPLIYIGYLIWIVVSTTFKELLLERFKKSSTKAPEPEVIPILKPASQLKEELVEVRAQEKVYREAEILRAKREMLESIVRFFDNKNYPFNLVTNYSHESIYEEVLDTLKPELEAAGYEIVDIKTWSDFKGSFLDTKEVHIKE